MVRWVVVLLIFNGIDCLSTLQAIQTGSFYEVNPLMRVLLQWSPMAFLLVKTGAALPLLTVIGRPCSTEMAMAIKVVTVVYGCLILWHAVSWAAYLAG